jgi:hypothetical protein
LKTSVKVGEAAYANTKRGEEKNKGNDCYERMLTSASQNGGIAGGRTEDCQGRSSSGVEELALRLIKANELVDNYKSNLVS